MLKKSIFALERFPRRLKRLGKMMIAAREKKGPGLKPLVFAGFFAGLNRLRKKSRCRHFFCTGV
jgi:hypothetical protein